MKKNYILIICIVFLLIVAMFSCGPKINASMTYGTVMDTYKPNKIDVPGNYGLVVFRAKKDTAEYNTWINLYFPMGVNRKDDVVVIPQKYLDSLIKELQVRQLP